MLRTLLQSPIEIIVVLLTAGLLISVAYPSIQIKTLKLFILSVSLAARVIGLIAIAAFDKATLGFQFRTHRLDVESQDNLNLIFGLDGVALIFVVLTLFTFPICFLSAWQVTKQPKQFFSYLLARELLLVLTFSTLDLFYFYVFFESLLIPRFILIGVWGARERKIKAAYYFFLYTLFGSLVRLFGILYLYFITGSTNYFVILNTDFEPTQQKIIWICFFLAFAVKRPLFPFHIWLPEAHVEAPTVGSRLLASLRLKLGGYGFLRFNLERLNAGSVYYAPAVAALSLLGVIYGSLSTIRQLDLKRIVAYSSVAHRNLVRLGRFSRNQIGTEGAIYLRVGHGVISTGLFFSIGVIYDRHHSRLLRYYGGLITVRPLFCTALLRLTLANRSFPGTSNFLGELLLFVGLFSSNSLVLTLATASIVLSSVYSLRLYVKVSGGSLKTSPKKFEDLRTAEGIILLLLVVSSAILGITSGAITDLKICYNIFRLNAENFSGVLAASKKNLLLFLNFFKVPLTVLVNKGKTFSPVLNFDLPKEGCEIFRNCEPHQVKAAYDAYFYSHYDETYSLDDRLDLLYRLDKYRDKYLACYYAANPSYVLPNPGTPEGLLKIVVVLAVAGFASLIVYKCAIAYHKGTFAGAPEHDFWGNKLSDLAAAKAAKLAESALAAQKVINDLKIAGDLKVAEGARIAKQISDKADAALKIAEAKKKAADAADFLCSDCLISRTLPEAKAVVAADVLPLLNWLPFDISLETRQFISFIIGEIPPWGYPLALILFFAIRRFARNFRRNCRIIILCPVAYFIFYYFNQ